MPIIALMQPQIQQNERCTPSNHSNSTSSRIAIDSLLNHSLSATTPSSISSKHSMQSLLHPSSAPQSSCSPITSSPTPPFYPSPILHTNPSVTFPNNNTISSSYSTPNFSPSSTLPSSNITQITSPETNKPPISPQALIVKTSNGKRHRCTYTGCGRDFTRLSNLKAHWRRHSGEEPYACTHCSRKFKWRSSLKSHELGCVFEFTKRNSHLKWVYLTPQGNFPAMTTQQSYDQLQHGNQDHQQSQFWTSSQSTTQNLPHKHFDTIGTNQYQEEEHRSTQSSVNVTTQSQSSRLMETPFSANRHSF